MHLVSLNSDINITAKSGPGFAKDSSTGGIKLTYRDVSVYEMSTCNTNKFKDFVFDPTGKLYGAPSKIYSVKFDSTTVGYLKRYKLLHTVNPLTEEQVRTFLESLDAENPEEIDNIIEELFGSATTEEDSSTDIGIKKYSIVLFDNTYPEQLVIIASDSNKDKLIPLASSLQLSAKPNETYLIITAQFPTINVSFS